MLAENAAALVGAGVLTVLVFPAVAVALRGRAPAGPAALDGPVDGPVDGADDVPGRTTPA
jgi:hypothetical protein